MSDIKTFTHENLNVLQQHDCVEPIYKMHIGPDTVKQKVPYSLSFCCHTWTSISPILPRWRDESNPLKAKSLKELWFCEEIENLRKTVIKSQTKKAERNFKYCNPKNCQYLGNPELWMPSSEENDSYIKKWEQGEFFIPMLCFDPDKSCQLRCPSCRTHLIYNKNILEEDPALKQITEDVITEFNNGNIKFLEMNNSGDPLVSPACMHILDNVKGIDGFSEIHLHTNGLAFTEKWWNEHKNLHHMIKHLQISLDAGNKECYDKVRLGGRWDIIIKNLDFIANELPNIDTSINLVTQKNNFKSMPEFIELGRKWNFHCNITRLTEWHGVPNEWYEANSCILEPKGVIPELEDVIRSLPPLDDIRVSFGNLVYFIKHIRDDIK